MTTKSYVFKVPYTKEEPVEVSFPIYGEHDISSDLDSTIIYYRIEAVGDLLSRTSIRMTSHFGSDGGVEYEIKHDPYHHFDPRDLDYALGRGEHASSKEQFDKQLAAALAFMQSLQ